jgi:lipopolysaccharide transport system permease protein
VRVFDATGTPLIEELAEYRQYVDLFRFLALRDIRLRYRQTLLGVAWAIVQPLLPMLIFTVIFSRFLRPETGGVPYPLFIFTGLTLWTFVASSILAGSTAFISNFSLLNKVYFPRAILPTATVAVCAFDGLIAGAVVMVVTCFCGYLPTARWLLLPAIALWLVVLATAATLLAASLTVAFRDMKNVIPFLVQIWMYSTPVLYPANLIPMPLRFLAGANPMTGPLEAFRACLLHTAPDWRVIAESGLSLFVVILAAVSVYRFEEAHLAERA